jgi:hypothetical protein
LPISNSAKTKQKTKFQKSIESEIFLKKKKKTLHKPTAASYNIDNSMKHILAIKNFIKLSPTATLAPTTS